MLTDREKTGIVMAAQSTFRRLTNLYAEVAPVYQTFGFTPPSAGVLARDLSEQIERAIVLHCPTFTRGDGHADLQRAGDPFEVKVCTGRRLTINQSKQIAGEHYIVINYDRDVEVSRVWILRQATDADFSPRRRNANARHCLIAAARPRIDVLFGDLTAARSPRPDPRPLFNGIRL